MEAATQVFWFLADRLSDFARLLTPFFLVGSALAWVVRYRSITSVAALLGASLFAGSVICRYFVPKVRGTAFSYMVPAEQQSGFIYFFFVYAWWLGLATFAVATLVHFLRSPPSKSL